MDLKLGQVGLVAGADVRLSSQSSPFLSNDFDNGIDISRAN